jgi:hypothetical protein
MSGAEARGQFLAAIFCIDCRTGGAPARWSVTSREAVMRAILLMSAILAAFVLLAPTAGHTDPYRWCAQYSGLGGGGRNCGFVTLAQCQATVSGIGGFCEPNTFYTGSERAVRRHKKTVDRY